MFLFFQKTQQCGRFSFLYVLLQVDLDVDSDTPGTSTGHLVISVKLYLQMNENFH